MLRHRIVELTTLGVHCGQIVEGGCKPRIVGAKMLFLQPNDALGERQRSRCTGLAVQAQRRDEEILRPQEFERFRFVLCLERRAEARDFCFGLCVRASIQRSLHVI